MAVYFAASLIGMPRALATPSPYTGSAFAQLPMWRTLISLGASPMARAVFLEQSFLLLGAHHPEQRTGLRVVIVIVLSVAPMICCTFEVQRRLAEFGLFLPLAVAVRLVTQRAAVVIVHRAWRRRDERHEPGSARG